MEGSGGKKLKRTLADRIASQESVEKKFEKTNLSKKKKLENKKKRKMEEKLKRQSQSGQSGDESASQSLGTSAHIHINQRINQIQPD